MTTLCQHTHLHVAPLHRSPADCVRSSRLPRRPGLDGDMFLFFGYQKWFSYAFEGLVPVISKGR